MVVVADGGDGDGDGVSFDGDNGDGGGKDKRIKLPYLFPRVTLTNYHRSGDLQQ